MEHSLCIHFPRAKFEVTWQNIPWHVITYYAMALKYFLESTKGLLILNMGLADRALKCNLM
jgi:hypothetical protein